MSAKSANSSHQNQCKTCVRVLNTCEEFVCPESLEVIQGDCRVYPCGHIASIEAAVRLGVCGSCHACSNGYGAYFGRCKAIGRFTTKVYSALKTSVKHGVVDKDEDGNCNMCKQVLAAMATEFVDCETGALLDGRRCYVSADGHLTSEQTQEKMDICFWRGMHNAYACRKCKHSTLLDTPCLAIGNFVRHVHEDLQMSAWHSSHANKLPLRITKNKQQKNPGSSAAVLLLLVAASMMCAWNMAIVVAHMMQK